MMLLTKFFEHLTSLKSGIILTLSNLFFGWFTVLEADIVIKQLTIVGLFCSVTLSILSLALIIRKVYIKITEDIRRKRDGKHLEE